MDGPHDLGGREDFGPIEVDAPEFREPWERRMWALSQLARAPIGKSIDAWRHTIECLPPPVYLGVSYFEKWCLQHLALAVLTTGVPVSDVARRASGGTGAAATKPDPGASRAAIVAAVAAREANFECPAPEGPLFAVGDRVRTLRRGHPGHTRLPAFARAAEGVVLAYRGAHVFPDLSAEGTREGRHLYTVEISAAELWGEGADPRDSVCLDLWEPYLAAA